VDHYVPRPDGTALACGEIGVRSFGADFGDKARVTAELAEPAHCFLLALNPDGAVQLCWPEQDETIPGQLERLDYPENAGRGFTLSDDRRGGLQAFVLVASRQPLPSYAEWRRRLPQLTWAHVGAAPGVVWQTDGTRLDSQVLSNEVRGPVEDLEGLAPLTETIRQLRGAEGVEAVAAVAFGVRPQR
jgi:hypothetical protein